MQEKKFLKNLTFTPILSYGNELSKDNIGLRLLKKAEKNIVIKSHTYKIAGMTPDDIAQELRMKIWNSRYSYVPKKSSMSTFVNFVIKNCIKDLFKSSKREKQILNKSVDIKSISDEKIEKGFNEDREF